ncbi:DUF397 domain-containing protein [Peterkaempfera bronchialis]|uniref:DUF397 domain-containing protein n=1 Tax=Peterkaempfera bronchialis TaxID=2126346 RepID=A0A345SX93_9ACTN|nr:DUF397 domain-containing protein [Peterkaempfera bronchialis]AXI78348.1 DUF397 domain-containing protein [Peterkaempfera bronchialis]
MISPDVWKKSSYSGGNNNCVEVTGTSGDAPQVLVRDSKDPHGPKLGYSGMAWSAFVSALRAGELSRH